MGSVIWMIACCKRVSIPNDSLSRHVATGVPGSISPVLESARTVISIETIDDVADLKNTNRGSTPTIPWELANSPQAVAVSPPAETMIERRAIVRARPPR